MIDQSYYRGDNSYNLKKNLTIDTSMNGDTYVCRCDGGQQGSTVTLAVFGEFLESESLNYT